MAEAKKPAPAAEPAPSAPKSKKNLILYIVIGLLVLVILVGGAFGAWLFVTISANQNFGEQSASESHSDSDKKDDKEKKKKEKREKKEHDGPPIFDKLDTYTVNLQGGSVLQTEIHIQVVDEKQKEVIKSYLPRISSQINLLLSSKKPEEIASLEGKVALMAELKQAINKVLDAKDDEDGVMSVEFKSFIVQ